MRSFFNLQGFGGSAKVAKELFDLLQPENAEFVTEEEMIERLDDVLRLYLKKKDDDKSGLYFSVPVVPVCVAVLEPTQGEPYKIGSHLHLSNS